MCYALSVNGRMLILHLHLPVGTFSAQAEKYVASMALKNRWKHTATGVGKRHTVNITSVRNCVVSSMSQTTANPVKNTIIFYTLKTRGLSVYDSQQEKQVMHAEDCGASACQQLQPAQIRDYRKK